MLNKVQNELLIEIGNWSQIANALGYSVGYARRVCQVDITRVFRVYGIAGMPAILMRNDKLIEIARAMSTQAKLSYQCRGIGIDFVRVLGDSKVDGKIVRHANDYFFASNVSIDGHYVRVDAVFLGVVK